MMPLRNQSLKELNWWKVGGEAEYFLAPQTEQELSEAISWWQKNPMPIYILSAGSNILIQDGLIKGLVLSLHQLSGVESAIEQSGRLQIICLAGTPKSEIAKIFLQKKLAPAVFLTGIPGDMGGGVVMNAGVGEQRTPREFCEIIDWIEVFPLDKSEKIASKKILTSDLKWEYRHSSGWQPGVISRVQVSWPLQADANVMNEVREATKKRVATQPLNQPSCGSVFRNPPGHKSAQLIEAAGLKGFSIGGAQVSTKHANFIINTGHATAMDIRKLIDHVRETIQKSKNLELQTEVQFIGDWN